MNGREESEKEGEKGAGKGAVWLPASAPRFTSGPEDRQGNMRASGKIFGVGQRMTTAGQQMSPLSRISL